MSASAAWVNRKPHKSAEHARELQESTRAMRIALSRQGGDLADTKQGFHVTHLLMYEGELVARVFRSRGMHYTLEQWTNGEYGLRAEDLREGESFVKV